MRENEQWRLFTDLRYSENNDTLRKIAELIRQGHDEQRFRQLLADHIDPDKATPFGTKLVVKYASRGTPKKKPKGGDLGRYLWRHIDVWGEPTESVVADARARLGVSRTRCFEELDRFRAMFRRDPELERLFRQSEQMLREEGHADAAPFSPGK